MINDTIFQWKCESNVISINHFCINDYVFIYNIFRIQKKNNFFFGDIILLPRLFIRQIFYFWGNKYFNVCIVQSGN